MTPSDFTEKAERCLQGTPECMDLGVPRRFFLHGANACTVVSGLLKNVTCVPGEVFFLVKTTL